jgi:hypothetical protein
LGEDDNAREGALDQQSPIDLCAATPLASAPRLRFNGYDQRYPVVIHAGTYA